MKRATGLATIVILAISAQAWAQDEGPVPGVGSLTQEATDEGLSGGFDMGVGFARIGEDSFIETSIGFTISVSKLAVGLVAPLRFRIIDEAPETDSIIREEDWDEVSDWFRILRFIQWGTRQDTVYVRGGELVSASMGHGTIINGYNNVVDVNHFQWGLNGALNLAEGGFELLLDNIVSLEVFGFRTFVRPWAFVDPESFWTNLAFGITFAGDRDAPLELATNAQGEFIVDDKLNLVVDEREETYIVGFDIELEVLRTELVTLLPYTDVNVHVDQGSGFHLGILANFTFSEAFALNSRLEFRALGEGYEPEYFDGLYEYERLLFGSLDATGQLRPKLQVMLLQPPESRIGAYGELTFDILGMFFLTAAYQDYQGDDNASFWARLALPEVGPISFGVYYINQNFDGFGEFFDLDNALFVSELRANVFGPLYLLAQYSRRFAALEDGSYEPVDDWAFGAGVSFGF